MTPRCVSLGSLNCRELKFRFKCVISATVLSWLIFQNQSIPILLQTEDLALYKLRTGVHLKMGYNKKIGKLSMSKTFKLRKNFQGLLNNPWILKRWNTLLFANWRARFHHKIMKRSWTQHSTVKLLWVFPNGIEKKVIDLP